MPVVGRYGQQRVDTAPIANTMRQAHETDLSSGVGLDRARGETAGVLAEGGATIAQRGLEHFAKVQQEERERADDTALLTAQNSLSTWENERLYNPDTGALAQKGRNALGLPDSVNAEYNDVANQIAGTLTNQRQKDAFARVRASRGESLDLTIRRHTFGEMQSYEAGELKTFVDNQVSSAVQNAQDLPRVASDLRGAVDAIRKSGPRLGLGPEQVDAQIQATTSAVHTGVIEQYLALGQDRAATMYFEETRDQIQGEKIGQIEKALKVGSVRGEATRTADAIIAEGGSLTEQRAKAKEIEDPDVRDAVNQRLEHEFDVARAQKNLDDENHLRSMFDIIDKSPDVNRIPPADWARLDGNERSSLRDYAKHLAAGTPIQTNWTAYYGLMQKASDDPEAFADFSKTNLLTYRAEMQDDEWKQLVGLQTSIRAGDRKKSEANLQGFRSTKQVVDDGLATFGIDPNPKAGTPQDEAIARLRRLVDQQAEEMLAITPGKTRLEPGDVQGIVDDLLGQFGTRAVKGSWWNIWPGGQSFTDVPGGVFLNKSGDPFTPDDIPGTDRLQIESFLKSKGMPTDPTSVLNFYYSKELRRRGQGK